MPAEWLSKEIGIRLLEQLEVAERPTLLRTLDSAMAEATILLERGPVLFKGVHSCAGRAHLKVEAGGLPQAEARLQTMLDKHGGLVLEPWLERVADFSMLYEKSGEGVEWIGASVMENDAQGRYLGSRVAPKWTSLLDAGVSTWLHTRADIQDWIRRRWPQALEQLLPDYVGPLGIDCLVHRHADGSLDWRPVVELNVRMSMGRIALELMRKSRSGCSGSLRFLRKSMGATPPPAGSLEQGPVLLNDPDQAREFLVVWEVDASRTGSSRSDNLNT